MTISLLTADDFRPKTFVESAKVVRNKTAMTSEEFDTLSAEHRARAFRIAGVNKVRLIQRARDVVANAVEQGTSFGTVRRTLLERFKAADVTPPSANNLRVMFRQNVQGAYSVARTRTLKDPEIAPAFPFWQYLTVGNGKPGINGVRDTHAALHGKVFRADDPFWDHFDPPWEWGCRCFKRALTPGQVSRMGVKVIDENYVRKKLRVAGQKKRGITPNPEFDFARDSFDATQFDLSGLIAELRAAFKDIFL